MKKPLSAFMTAFALALAFLIIQLTGFIAFGIYYGIQAGIAGNQPDSEAIQAAILDKSLWISLFAYVTLLLFSWLLLKIRRIKIRQYISFTKVPFKSWPILLAMALALQVLGQWAVMGLDAFYPVANDMNAMLSVINSGSPLLSLVVIVLLAPIAEEIFFRGLIFRKLQNHMPLAAAIFLQGLLFALIHLNIAQMIPVFIMGCAAAWVYHKYQSISYAIRLHVFFNLQGFVTAQLPETIQQPVVIAFNVIGTVSLLAILGDLGQRFFLGSDNSAEVDFEADDTLEDDAS